VAVVELIRAMDDGIPEGVVFISFAYVEAAANLLTNAKTRIFRSEKSPNSKFCRRQGEGRSTRRRGWRRS